MHTVTSQWKLLIAFAKHTIWKRCFVTETRPTTCLSHPRKQDATNLAEVHESGQVTAATNAKARALHTPTTARDQREHVLPCCRVGVSPQRHLITSALRCPPADAAASSRNPARSLRRSLMYFAGWRQQHRRFELARVATVSSVRRQITNNVSAHWVWFGSRRHPRKAIYLRLARSAAIFHLRACYRLRNSKPWNAGWFARFASGLQETSLAAEA